MFILVHHFFCDQSGCKLKSVYSVSVVQECKASLEWKTVHSSLFTASLAQPALTFDFSRWLSPQGRGLLEVSGRDQLVPV